MWFADFKQWAARPFSQDMDATHWFLFIGLLIAISVGWNLILHTIYKHA